MALTNLGAFTRPTDLSEAWDLLEAGDAGVQAIAGGTDLVMRASPQVTGLIDHAALPLRYINQDDAGIRIGAMATFTDALEHDGSATYYDGVIAGMMLRIASPLLRNQATIGGNLVRHHAWSDVPLTFQAIDAQVTVYAGESRTLSLAAFYDQGLNHDKAILTEILLPAQPLGSALGFFKFVRNEADIAVLNSAAYVAVHDDGRVAAVRILVGGRPRAATRVPAAEAALLGNTLDPAAIDAAARIAQDDVEVGDDRRASTEYRKHLVHIAVKRALGDAATRLEVAP
mgnify:FL=1